MITLKIMITGYDKRHGCRLRKIPKEYSRFQVTGINWRIFGGFEMLFFNFGIWQVFFLEIFMAQEFGMGFFGVSSFAPIRSSLSCEIWSTPPPPHPRGKLKGAQCSEPVKSKKKTLLNQDFLVVRKKKIRCQGPQWTLLEHRIERHISVI